MTAKGLNMKMINEICRLSALGFGKRKIAQILKIHRATVTKYLEASPTLIHTPHNSATDPAKNMTLDCSDDWANAVDWQAIRDQVLQGITLNVIHDELVQSNIVTVQYPAFWKQLQKRAPTSQATMVRVFAPGSRIEIDYCDGINLVNVSTGEIIKTEFFVGVLCCSRYTFAEFTLSQKSGDFLASHVRMFDYFGGCSQVLSPDNLKSAITKAHRYDPVINPAYARLAAHYNVAVVPARVRTPKDKAIVERTIQIFQRWFFMCIRNITFTSLVELNNCIKKYLEIFNNKKHRVFGKTRMEMFEQERCYLLPLPAVQYQMRTYARAQLARDCHLIFDKNHYSAPHTLRGLELEIWATSNTIEIYLKDDRVAFHARGKTTHKFITDKTHYPPGHQAYVDEDVDKLKQKAIAVGPETAKLVDDIFSDNYPLKHLRKVQGLLSLSKKYNKTELEKAVTVANAYNQKGNLFIERVIKKVSLETAETNDKKINRSHNINLRGVENIIATHNRN